MATGPSLTARDSAAIRAARAARADLRVVAVSDAGLDPYLPDADLLYACDAKWWGVHDGAPSFAGERWSQTEHLFTRKSLNAEAWETLVTERGINLVRSRRGGEPSFDPEIIAQGANSGFQAVNLAVLMGARRIVLVGFDMGRGEDGRSHCFGDHPGELQVASPFGLFIRMFERAAPVYAERGIEVVNASRRTALTCFRRVDLDEVLGERPRFKRPPPPLMIRGMYGLGDNIMSRPFIRAAAAREGKVYLTTPWPELFKDLPGVLPVRSKTTLRTQAKNEARSDRPWYVPPTPVRQAQIGYGSRELATGSIAQAMERTLPLDGEPYVLDLPEFDAPEIDTGGKPLAIVRPVTARSEWLNEARNPLPEYVSAVAARLRRTHFVLIAADLAPGKEWLVGGLPPHDAAFLAGEIATPALLGLMRRAACVVGGVGWIVPASLALRVPCFAILGGNGGHNAPEKITDPRQDLSRLGFARPPRLCMCGDKNHRCEKRIPDLMTQLESWAGRTGVNL